MKSSWASPRTIRLFVSLLLATACASATGTRPPKPAHFTLTILHNNDGESRLIDAGAGALADFGGVARFATVVDTLRREALRGPGRRGVVLLSSGDSFLAGPQFNASLARGTPFYDSLALRRIGYDAVAIGNHEFDFGPDVLAEFIAGVCRERAQGRRLLEGPGCGTRFVSANLDVSAEPALQDLVEARIIVRSHVVWKGEWIGIVGATTPLLPAISSPRRVAVDPDYARAIQREIDRLQRGGVAIVIVISHLQSVREDLALAPLLRGVDVMIAGGGDELLANERDRLVPGDVRNPGLPYPLYATGADGARIPIVTTAGDYKYVGRLVVGFDGKGRLVSVEGLSGPVRVAGGREPDAVPPDPDLQAAVVAPVQTYVDDLARNVVGTSAVALEGRRGPTPPGVRTAETNLGNLMADALLWQANRLAARFGLAPAEVALQNGGGIRNNSLIPAGALTELDTFSMAAFTNFVSVVSGVPPARFKALMENAVSRIPAADGRFAQIAGFRLVYDPAGRAQRVDNAGNVLTPGARVVEIRLDDGRFIVQGGAVGPDAPPVNIATSDFLARGGDRYPFGAAPFTTLGVTYQRALLDYLVDALGRSITAADYPEGGEGRITTPARPPSAAAGDSSPCAAPDAWGARSVAGTAGMQAASAPAPAGRAFARGCHWTPAARSP